MTTPSTPAKNPVLSAEEFFAALKADPRDIMPCHEQRDVTVWKVQRTGAEWGRSTPGWANPEGAETYQVRS
jgi:hypothetical protein